MTTENPVAADPRTSASPPERRRLQRLKSRDSFVASTAGEFALVDVCPTGISISGDTVASLEVGQQHIFVVTDRGQIFEVVGEIRWVHPDDMRGNSRAGVAFVDIISVEPEGLWAGVCAHYAK